MMNTNALSTVGLFPPGPNTPANGIGIPQGGLLSARKAGSVKGGDYSIIAVL